MPVRLKSAACGLVLVLGVCVPETAALAQRTGRCLVTDPTGTRLNIRESPQGRIIANMPNGQAVRLVNVARDQKGQPWAFIVDWETGSNIGWVFREFVSCY